MQLNKNDTCKPPNFPIEISYPSYLLQSTRRKFLISFSELLRKNKSTEANSKRLIKLFSKWNRSPFWGRHNLMTGRHHVQCSAECCWAAVMCSPAFTNRQQQPGEGASCLPVAHTPGSAHLTLCFCKPETLHPLSASAEFREPAPKGSYLVNERCYPRPAMATTDTILHNFKKNTTAGSSIKYKVSLSLTC